MRDKRIYVRVTAAEQERIEKNAESYGMSVSDFFRSVGLKKRIKQPLLAKEDTTKLLSELRKIQGEMNRIGNNINQLTAQSHNTDLSQYKHSYYLQQRIQEQTEELTQLKNGVEELWQFVSKAQQSQQTN